MDRPPSTVRPAPREWWWILDPRQSLCARAATWVGLGTLTFTALLTWITGTIYRRTLEPQLGGMFEAMAFQLGDKLDRAVYERYRNVMLAASLGPVRDVDANPAERRRALEALQASVPELAWLGITDTGGRIVIGTGGQFEGTSAFNRSWFRSAREMPFAGPFRDIPELARQGPTPEHEAAGRFFDVAVPVTGSDGRFAGVLGAHIRWNWAQDVLLSVVPEAVARTQVGATAYAGNDVLLDSGASGWTRPPDPPALGDERRARGFIIERTTEGGTYLTGFARSRGYREYRGLGWVTVVRQPLARAFAPVTALQRSIALWGGALSFAAMGAAWFLASAHARRLRSVRASAERIHEGDILAILPRPPGNSELARMCAAVGDLVEDLRARTARPEHKDRTPAP